MKAVQLLVPAAGMGLRLGAEGPKALVDLGGVPMIVRTLRRFDSMGLLEDAIIVGPPGQREAFQPVLEQAFPGMRLAWVEGGAERQLSVSNGLAALSSATEVVVIHDAARPFVPSAAVCASIDAARAHGAATVAIPSIDTILVSDGEAFLVDTPDRRTLWACQTPQTFRVEVIRHAHAAAGAEDHLGTDDATLVRRLGGQVKLVMGSPLNFKVTTPDDFALALQVIKGGLA